jgi:hypothetical protein
MAAITFGLGGQYCLAANAGISDQSRLVGRRFSAKDRNSTQQSSQTSEFETINWMVCQAPEELVVFEEDRRLNSKKLLL